MVSPEDELLRAAAAKPTYGQPCNGCGLCCIMEQCAISEGIFGAKPRCPALEKADGNRLVCGLIVHPEAYLPGPGDVVKIMSEALGVMLGVSHGCDGVVGPEDRRLADRDRDRILEDTRAARAASKPEVRHMIDILAGPL